MVGVVYFQASTRYVCIAGAPVVIEGAIDHWPANEWTLDSLCKRVGQNDVYIRSNTNCHDYRVSFFILLKYPCIFWATALISLLS